MKKFSYSIADRITPRNEFVFNFCGEVKGKTILDIGCGFRWYEKMAVANKAKSITGIEPEEKYFYNARNEVPAAKFLTGTAVKLPFKKSSFNKVIMLEVLEHLSPGKESLCLKEINRVLVSGGEFILSTPNKHLISCLLDPAWYFGHRHYNLKFIKDLAEKNGFIVKEVFIYGGFWEMIRMIPHYFFKWIFNSEDPLKNFFEAMIQRDKENPSNFAYLYIKSIKK